jgi:hypothetical protein
MAYTLVFKKDDVEILSLGTGHALAVAFQNKPYDEFKPMARHEFADAMYVLLRQDESFEDDTEMLEKMLEHSTDWEEKWDIITRLHDIKKERQAIAKAKVMLEMLEMIWEEDEYPDNKSTLGLWWAVL